MAGRFYHDALEQRGITTVTPDAADRDILHDTIYTELVQNVFTDASRKIFLSIIEKLRRQGVPGVILGCTEIPLLIQQVPLFNTTAMHCEAAVAIAIEDQALATERPPVQAAALVSIKPAARRPHSGCGFPPARKYRA
ncbi:MAG: aspartate/glutamate racemase family protein, partial [Janthinobacterium sp.]